jgi:CheY-like chemotaxis protein
VTTAEAGDRPGALRVVLVDNRPERRALVRQLVAGTGLAAPDIAEAADANQAIGLLDRGDHDVAVVEIQIPVSEGLETIAALRNRASELRIVVCSFHRDPATKALALAHGADAYLDKPVGSLSLKTLLEELCSSVPAVTGPAHRPRPPG